MTDRKRNTARSQAVLKSSSESEKSVKAPARERESASVKSAQATKAASVEKTGKALSARQERRASRQEAKTVVRKESKGSSSFVARIRNNRLGRFFYDAYYELRHKVTWPTPKEARNMTIAVVALSAVVGGIIAIADFGLHQLFLWIIGAK
jgi:preprotein translocase SecE subunit